MTTPATSSPRDRILETAAQLFYGQGIRAVGVDTIIAQAQVAKMSFYKHFPSKADLVLAFLSKRDADWRAWLEGAVPRLAPRVKDRPLAVFDALAERFETKDFRGCAFINTMVETANREDEAHRAAATHKAAVQTYLAKLLVEAGHPSGLAEDLLLLMDGAVVAAVRKGSSDPAHRAKALAATILAAHSPKRT